MIEILVEDINEKKSYPGKGWVLGTKDEPKNLKDKDIIWRSKVHHWDNDVRSNNTRFIIVKSKGKFDMWAKSDKSGKIVFHFGTKPTLDAAKEFASIRKWQKSSSMKEDMSTSSAVDMNLTGKPKRKKKCETFNVSDDCFHKFRHGKTKFERWSRYLDLTDESQKKIYDWAKRHHNGTIILKNSTTGAIRGIRYNRTGGGQWGKITRLKEQVLETNQKFTVK